MLSITYNFLLGLYNGTQDLIPTSYLFAKEDDSTFTLTFANKPSIKAMEINYSFRVNDFNHIGIHHFYNTKRKNG